MSPPTSSILLAVQNPARHDPVRLMLSSALRTGLRFSVGRRHARLSDDESSVGEIESILPLFDERLGGYSNDDADSESYEPARHAVVYMAGNQSQPRYDA
jgi:hypothetical protein